MHFLRDRWRRTAWHQYFEAVDPIDRATFYIAVVLILAGALCLSQIVARS